MIQGQLFSPSTGQELRDFGIKKAVNTADAVDADWSEKAYKYFVSYLGTVPIGHAFMLEDVRNKSENVVPVPPSKRAWGYVVVKAKKEKLIECIGIKPVKNPRAHRANASIWIKI